MYKISLELGNITNIMKLRFSIIITFTNNNDDKIIDKAIVHDYLNNMDNEFVKINPHPFISIDIRGRNKYDSNYGVNLNRRNLFKFISILIEMRDRFNTKGLFINFNGELKMDIDIARTLTQVVSIGGKVLQIGFDTVTYASEGKPLTYEALYIAINRIEYLCKLTVDELDFLIWTLKNINMDMMCMQLLQLYIEFVKNEGIFKDLTVTKTIQQSISDENFEAFPLINHDNSEIPDI